MSLPWLTRNQPRSKSKSPGNEKTKKKVDQFGRSLPSKSKSRSRSRSRSSSSSSSRDRSNKDKNSPRHSRESSSKRNQKSDRYRDSKRGRTENYKRDKHSSKRRSRSSSSGSNSDSSSSSNKSTRIVASTKPKYLNARVFVANIISKEITKEELIKQFEKYGEVTDILVHSKNYAFVQFTKEEHARLAVEGENGSTLKGWRLDVKMAKENRKGGTTGGKGFDRGGRGSRGHFGNSERDISPLRDPAGPVRDPFIDPYFSGRPRAFPGRPPMPFPLVGMRDPYFMDPYRRGFPEPWMGEDPYRRSMFPDPYRDLYDARPPPPPVIECEIFVTSAQLQSYGEAVEQRIKQHHIITAVSVMGEGRTAAQLVEELTAQNGLFAVFINAQNEMHRSLTLNILHGIPQEHRNMPLDDAVTLVGKSFVKYVEGLRDKAQAASTPLPSSTVPRVFLPASPEVAYLLNLLADNRALTVAELNSIITYLQERRDKLIDAESRPILSEENYLKSAHGDGRAAVASQQPSSYSQDLTSKILSLFGNAGGNIQGVPPADGGKQQSLQSKLPIVAPPPPSGPLVSAPSTASLINFNNPNVQKALDSLIQNSPHLLKNISTKKSLPTAHTDASNPSSSIGSMSSGYGQSGEMAASHTQGHYDGYGLQGQMMSNSGYTLQGSTGMFPMGEYGSSGEHQTQGQMDYGPSGY